MSTTFDRRRFLHLSGLAAGTVVLGGGLAGCRGSSGSSQTDTLVINSFGGTFQEAIEQVVVAGFESKYNASVDVTTAISTDALAKLKASPKNDPALDVAYMDLAPIYQARAAGLLQPMDSAQVPSLSQMHSLAVDKDGYWVAELVSMTGIAYNTEKVKTPPKSWMDLWNPEYAGHVAISDVAGTAGYQFLAEIARLNGGSEKDIDPGFEQIAKLKPSISAIYKDPDEMSRLLTTEEAWVGPWYADRLSSLKREGAPVSFVTPTEGAIAVLSAMCIPKGTPQADMAHNYIDYQISAKVNKEFITTIAEGPTNSQVKLDDKFLGENFIPYGTAAIDELVSLDSKVIAANLSDWITRWQSQIAS